MNIHFSTLPKIEYKNDHKNDQNNFFQAVTLSVIFMVIFINMTHIKLILY